MAFNKFKKPEITPRNFGYNITDQAKPDFFINWINYCNSDIHNQNFDKIKKFVNSNRYCIEYKDLGLDLSEVIRKDVA